MANNSVRVFNHPCNLCCDNSCCGHNHNKAEEAIQLEKLKLEKKKIYQQGYYDYFVRTRSDLATTDSFWLNMEEDWEKFLREEK